jgi:hypothetical protein
MPGLILSLLLFLRRFKQNLATATFLKLAESAATAFGAVAHFFELGDEAVAMLALNLDLPVFYRAAGAALFLELAGNFFEIIFGAGQSAYYSNAGTFATFGFSPDSDYTVFARWRGAASLATRALRDRFLAIRAHFSPFA